MNEQVDSAVATRRAIIQDGFPFYRELSAAVRDTPGL